MTQTVRKSQFKDDGSGNKIIKGHFTAKDDVQVEEVISDTPPTYASSNEAVGTIAPDPDNKKGFIISFKGDGQALFTASVNADPNAADPVDNITGSLDLTFVEDLATHLDMVLDL